MTAREDYYYRHFLQHLGFQPTSCQDALFRQVASFITADDDLMLVNGYAGTGKTSAFAAIIAAMKEAGVHCSLMAPTGQVSAHAPQEMQSELISYAIVCTSSSFLTPF